MGMVRIRIVPYPGMTGIWVRDESGTTVLEGWLPEGPRHPRAVAALAEALALWWGVKIHVALAAAAAGSGCDTKPWLACLEANTPSALFDFKIVAADPNAAPLRPVGGDR